MTREGTKDAAEAVLRELPSVIGAFVREDVHGHPREVHLLIRPGPNPKMLAYDVRELLEERLGVPVDQRIISIAQLASGRRPGPLLADAAGFEPLPEQSPPAPPPEPEPAQGEPRVRFAGFAMDSMDNRVRIRVSLRLDEAPCDGEALGVDTAPARLRTVAAATLQAVNGTCIGRARFEVEQTASISAFDRDYVVVSVLASSPWLGRRPVQLVGAQPVELDPESAAALAALKAVNRTLSLVLRLPATGAARPGRSPRPARS
jgi:hypothetical protein